MKLSPLLLALFSGIIFASCDKEEFIYPGPLLRGQSLVKTSDILVYSSGQRVTDQGKIARFLSGDPAWIDLENEPGYENETIQFIRADSAVLSGETGVSVEYLDGRAILKSQNPSGLGSDSHDVPLMKYPEERIPISPVSGFDYRYFPTYVGHGSPTHFRLSVLIYKISYNRWKSYSKQMGIAYNEFNTRAIEMLTQTDTLAVQTFELVFSR